MDDLKAVCSAAVSVKVYHTKSTANESKAAIHHDATVREADIQVSNLITHLGLSGTCITPIPVHSISSRSRPARLALEIFA